MQLLYAYLYQCRRTLLAAGLCIAVFGASFALYHLPLAAVLYPAGLCAALGAGFLLHGYTALRRRHRLLARLAQIPDDVPAALPAPQSLTEADCQAIIAAQHAHLAAWQADADARWRDTVDYYTTWAHQIKTPIAAMQLALQSEDSPLARRLGAEVFRIEQYVGMVLTFLRLDSAATDYVFRPCALDALLTDTAKKFAAVFIDRRLRLEYTPTHLTVLTDEKWLAFVVEQLLSNAIKYTPDGGCVRVGLCAPKVLRIADTGIGIAPQDLPRVFEKGYTGQNGRRDRRASGLGLYLCKRVCDNLGIAITLTSEVGQGTAVCLDLEQYPLKSE